MKKTLLLLCCLACSMASAQTMAALGAPPITTSLPTGLNASVVPQQMPVASPFRKNNVKMNLSSLALKNYNFSYERSLTRKISFVAGYRFMPSSVVGDLLAVEKLSDQLFDEDDDLKNDLNNMHTSNQTFTGEFRFYGGKKPGARGFYLSLYGRHTSMKLDYLYDYETSAYDANGFPMNEKNYQIPLKNDLKGIGGGLMIGAQWLIAKRVVLDWYILGGHYGKLTGDIDAVTDLSSMTAEEKADLQREIAGLVEVGDIQFITDVVVTDTGVQAKADGPFLGIRGAGISLGIAF